MANESYADNPVSPNVQNLLGFFNSREDSFRIINKSLASWSFNGGIPSKIYDVRIWDPVEFKFNVLPGDFVIVFDQLGEYVARPVIIVEPENPAEFFDITYDPSTKVSYTVAGATAGASTVTYTTSADHDFTTNTFVTVSGISPSQFNTTKTKVTAVTNNTFTVDKTITGSYSSGGSVYAQAKFNSNLIIKYLNSYGLESDYIIETYLGSDGYPENYIEVIREDWSNKYLGTSGWILSGSGNSIFNNVAVRGEITADTLDVGGEEGITYDGTTVRIGTDVTIAGSVTANSFSIDANNFWNTVGNLGSFKVGNATSYFYWDNAAQSLSTTGQLTVGTNAIAINILGATTAAGTKIYSGTNSTFNNTGNTGFYIDASGRFSLGTTTNTAGMSWDGSTLAVKGAITATSGTFTGTVNINTGGSLVTGTTADGITIDSTGLYGYEQGTQIFSIPTSSSLTPSIANFKVVDTTIYSDGLDASLILGTRGFSGVISGGTIGTVTVDGSYTAATITGMTGATSLLVGQVITATSGTGTIPADTIVKKINSSTSISVASLNTIVAGTVTNITGVGGYNIQVRGQDSGGASPATPAAIFTTINGVTTTATLNNGFYMDRTGKFRLAGANGSVSMDGSGNLSVSGIINATSGNFTSTVTIGNGATTGTLQVGTNASNYFKIDGTNTSTTTAIYTNGASYGVSGVWLDASGRFSLGTGLTYSSGNLSVTGAITASTGAIGGFTIEPTRLFTTEGTGITAGLTSGTSNFSFFSGADNKAGLNSKFSVTNAGALTATTATITGTINATSGFIGGSTNGWTIASNLLSNGNVGLFAPVSTIGTGTIAARTNAVTAVTASSPSVGFATYTATGHTFTTGNIVTITGASVAGYNGTFTITAVATNTFTVANSTTGATTFTSGLATSRNTITLTSPTITPVVGMSITGTNLTVGSYITALTGAGPYVATLSSSTLGNVSGTGTISNYAIYAGNATRQLAPFKVDYAGNLTATNANITGAITATSGTIGGFIIPFTDQNRLSSTITQLDTGVKKILLDSTIDSLGVLNRTNLIETTFQSKADAFGDYALYSAGLGFTLKGATTITQVVISGTAPNKTIVYTVDDSSGIIAGESTTISGLDGVAAPLNTMDVVVTSKTATTVTVTNYNTSIANQTITGQFGTMGPLSTPYLIADNTAFTSGGSVQGYIFTAITADVGLEYGSSFGPNIILGKTRLSNSVSGSGYAGLSTVSAFDSSPDIMRIQTEGGGTLFGLDLGLIAPTDGGLFVGANTTTAASAGVYIQNSGVIAAAWRGIQFYRRLSAGADPVATGFINVQNNTTVAPSFAAGSDYRLKKNIVSAEDNFMNIIKSLRPVRYDESNTEHAKNILGFIAHEVATIIPEAVQGEKDAVSEDGSPEYQTLAQAQFVPYLVGALKDAIEKIEDLEQRLAVLEP